MSKLTVEDIEYIIKKLNDSNYTYNEMPKIGGILQKLVDNKHKFINAEAQELLYEIAVRWLKLKEEDKQELCNYLGGLKYRETLLNIFNQLSMDLNE